MGTKSLEWGDIVSNKVNFPIMYFTGLIYTILFLWFKKGKRKRDRNVNIIEFIESNNVLSLLCYT